MRERRYYQDATTMQFKAHVVEHTTYQQEPAVILDQTYFYPTSGGQPHDTGWLNDTAVTNVVIRPTDGRILHVLAETLNARQVNGRINRERRFDHMQHHTGQHILSQAILRLAHAQTVGFHLSENTVTIDLDCADLAPSVLTASEQLTNQIIWENRPVGVRMVTQAEADVLPLRKVPEVDGESLRMVEIADFDLTACGGTHVEATGAVGVVKIVKTERRGDKLRVHFLCGRRALTDYHTKQAVVDGLMAQLTTGSTELTTAVAKLQDENKRLQRRLRRLQNNLHQFQAQSLLQKARTVGAFHVVTTVWEEGDAGQLRALGTQLSRHRGTVALLGLTGTRSHLIFCRHADAPGDMQRLLKNALQALGSSAGGGSETFAQGAGPAVETNRLRAVLDKAAQSMLEEMAGMR